MIIAPANLKNEHHGQASQQENPTRYKVDDSQYPEKYRFLITVYPAMF